MLHMSLPHTMESLKEAMKQYGDFSAFCEREIYPLPVERQAEYLSRISALHETPHGYAHPVDDAQSLIYLLKNTPRNVRFSSRPRLLAGKNISGMDLNRLSDFDIYLLDASSPMRVHCDISRCTIPAGSDIRGVNLRGLSARQTDFSKAKMNPEQLLDLDLVARARLPADMPLASLGGRLARLAHALNTLELHEENICGCDLSCTSYPLGKLFRNCNVFKGVVFPASEWAPCEFDDDGTPGPVLYSMAGCTFVGCDLRGISGLIQSEVDEASFSKCLLPDGLYGRDLKKIYASQSESMPAR